MKKLISLILALMLVFSMATVAFAAEGDTPAEEPETPGYITTNYNDKVNQPVDFSKTYDILGGKSPAETFNFRFTPYAAENSDGEDVFSTVKKQMPLIDGISTSFAELDADSTNTVEVSVDADDFPDLGVYTYEVVELAPNDDFDETTKNTAGVTYSSEKLYLVITILRDESNNQQYVAAVHYSTVDGLKTGTITNKYEAGSLSVTKKITGNMANMKDTFNFTVTFTAPNGEVLNSDIKLSVAGADATSLAYTKGSNTATATFSLGHEQTATFTNIPEGVTYTVVEDTPDDYKVTEQNYSDDFKTISNGDADTVKFTNDKTEGVDTGITLDSIPFILILAVCAGAAILFITKRRSVNF